MPVRRPAIHDSPFRALFVLAAVVVVGLSLASCALSNAANETHTASSHADGYWCPMHPDVRGGAGATCHICGMALVPASPADYRPYLLDFEVVPRALAAGEPGRITFRVLDPKTRLPVTQFEQLHERVFHLFILSHDLEYFAHVHPELRNGGTLDIDVTLPRPGAYRLIADFLPTGGAPQLIEKTFVTAGYRGDLSAVAALQPDDADKKVDGTSVKLIVPPPIAGREQLVTFELTDAATGKPVDTLQPYLGATGHLLVVSADLSTAFHSHPVAAVSSAFGPSIVFQLIFPRAGAYRLWVQYQRDGRVGTAPFTVAVKERAPD